VEEVAKQSDTQSVFVEDREDETDATSSATPDGHAILHHKYVFWLMVRAIKLRQETIATG
jgi:hypothetical protein